MLSISNIGSHQASTYYKKDGYYCRLDGRDNAWQGKLKDKLGLSDAVVKEDFDLLVGTSKERAGYDLCFSAPKSVSIGMCLDEETRTDMIDAHEKAVASVLAKIEEREIGTRITSGKVTRHVKTGNMLCGKFSHYVSRASDPQLHTHCVILNKTLYQGKEYAIDNPDLYRNKILYGQLYRNELAAQLLARGYDLRVADSQKGFFELKGVAESALTAFSHRRQEVLEKLKEWGTRNPEAAGRAAVLTRRAKEHRDLGLLTESWKETVNELGGVRIEKADRPIHRTDEQKRQEFDQAVQRLSRKTFAVTEQELKKGALAAAVASGVCEAEYDRLLKENKDLLPIGQRMDQPDGPSYYTTRQNLEAEKAIFQEVARTKGKMPGVTPEKVQAILQQKETPEAPLSIEQRQAVLGIVSSRDQYFAVQGLAGTGKTHMLSYARQVLEQEGYEVKGACFTGKAASGLEEGAHIPSSTIHSFLNRLEKEAGNLEQGQDLQEKVNWNFTGLKPGGGKEAWIVDEASMVDNLTMKNLMEAARIRQAKVVFVGDDRQLLPVGVGNAYGAMVETGKISSVTLTEIRRQKDKNLLSSVKEAARGDIGKSLDLLEKNVVQITKPKERFRAIVGEYATLSPDQQRGTIILTAANKDRRRLNTEIRAELKKMQQLPSGREYSVEDANGRSQRREFSQGDKVIFLQNDNRMDVKNGQTGIVEGIRDRGILVKSGDKMINVDFAQYKKIDHGYAMTAHKAQGITTDRALIHLDSGQKQMNSRNAYYVDISRAKYEVKIFTDNVAEIRSQVQQFAKKLTSEDFQMIKIAVLPTKSLTQCLNETAKEMLKPLQGLHRGRSR